MGARQHFGAARIQVVRVLGILTQTVHKGVPHGLRRYSRLIFHHYFLVPQLSEPWMFERLTRGDSVVGVVGEELNYEVFDFLGGVGNELHNASALCNWEVKLHVRGILLKLLQQVVFWCAHYIMNLVNLIELIVALRMNVGQGASLRSFLVLAGLETHL